MKFNCPVLLSKDEMKILAEMAGANLSIAEYIRDVLIKHIASKNLGEGKMEEYQKRVFEEKKELDKKIEALHIFINSDFFKTINEAEKKRLKRQLVLMELYQETLWDRLTNF